jgi:hypothetical protein
MNRDVRYIYMMLLNPALSHLDEYNSGMRLNLSKLYLKILTGENIYDNN